MIKIITAIFLIIFSFNTHSKEQNSPPKIAVSIKPIHSIAANITDGITEPYLIVNDNSSPHDYSLKPSAASNINEADIIIYISDELETFLNKTVISMGNDKKILQLIKTNGLHLLNNGKNLNNTEDEHDHHHGEIDPHIWLSSKNSVIIAEKILDILIEHNPQNAEKYTKNFLDFSKKNASASEKYHKELEEYKNLPFIVFHDAYRYFENEYGLNNIGSMTDPSSSGIGAKRIKEIEQAVNKSNVSCIFTEPQFSSAVIDNIFLGKDIKIKTLDPIGYEIEAGKDAYFIILDNIVNNIKSCLKG
ncbi:MAG: zinc ABC transporter substrate-binding protein [Rickettsiales bacterium]|nr:zinc ABC transporter substrate-binding protein [Pseudomonadota bacterium]MDA0966831.1 zinc ABC transporter substrate-binding protein [Pseudomonadota bacterium]MDG4543505.1 zinc ABC transporter substrate-binding protein [Rickettsiales bacterium]MDG4546101.1 zinc ABC transporter substrate-binding protein [Rickettsiales bacterium]MDG4547574.1 zinc ABC transporter substrate-binding protein [Rickettsiales bacterium]